jgi:hypothetical protein
LLGALVALLVVAGCRRDTRHPAERVVARYYIGISERDTDAVMDAVEAADRNMTGMGLLNVLDALSLEIGFVGIDLGALTATSIRQLRLDVVTRTADYALVQAQGNIRYQTFGYEVPFCFMHDVRRAGDGAWYIDLDAPEQAERLARILPQREAAALAQAQAADGSLGGLMGSMTDSLALAMNLCE